MRAAEWLNLAYFGCFVVLAWIRRLRLEQRRNAIALGAAGLGLTLAAIVSGGYLTAAASAIVRDWLPAPLMLLAYWQTGQFFVAPNGKFQARLEDFDRRWLGALVAHPWKGGLGQYLEFAYLFCYPAVPLALATLYATGHAASADEFWRSVLPASYFCYAMVPFFQTLPPRVREEAHSFGAAPGGLRGLNLGILRRASIHANTFPSAHVAASLAAALAVLRHLPAAGIVLLWIAASIAAGAVLRRYHFALDIIAGALVALVSLALSIR